MKIVYVTDETFNGDNLIEVALNIPETGLQVVSGFGYQ